MTDQRPVTTVAAVKPDAEGSSESCTPQAITRSPVGRLSTTQFARLVVLDTPGDPHGQPIEPQHAYMSDTDAPAERHLVEPSLDFPDGIHELFERCEGYEFEQLIEPRR